MNKIDRNFWLHIGGSFALAVVLGWWAILFGLGGEIMSGFIIKHFPKRWQVFLAKITFSNTGFSWFDMWTNGIGVILGTGVHYMIF